VLLKSTYSCTVQYVREGDEVNLASCLADQCLDALFVTRLTRRYGTYTNAQYIYMAQSIECSDFGLFDKIEHSKTVINAKLNSKTHLSPKFFVF
jgi:hypothetical protein